MVVASQWPGQPWYRELEAYASEVAFMQQDPFTPSRLGRPELLGPSGWDALEVYFRDDDAWYPGTITGVSEGTCHVTYDDGDEEALGVRE
ncbi:hypothetical protein CYMTET_34751 [Cymbomonas tetramitiformis]|uniref:Tudor domain-containing protein n=1 Tax=Cymbomonas tetramitiformis TaxID=36881 RepID=A0AAE0KPM9_9CHLO|nr:hypothetical protein CYMTET_34751 [Cymbomonas tetramitiformis]